ncbi:aminomethyl-transferring glycine dehydrogenase [Saccharicrinis sp. FJH54]|uniref:aminomethyl-transferring glycine dehydrogenase n=1 Tax=Saccharicrinis sp. FJH54 TaxID=3344665 RepID=UPI0035D46932
MNTDRFVSRHIGPRPHEIEYMLKELGVGSVQELIEQTIPSDILLDKPLDMAQGLTERQYYRRILGLASKNKVFNTYIGMGYYDTITPSVILRNVLENPVWYTSYTPYQAEISQGRLEALLNYQTVVCDMTGMELANASLLDEATAAAEAMIMMYNCRSRSQVKDGMNTLFVDENIWPQTLAVLKTRSKPLGITIHIGDFRTCECADAMFGAIVQYPNSDGRVLDYKSFTDKFHQQDKKVAVATDILSLALLVPPGEWGADIVFGSSQRFGVPMGYGGPAAAFFATREEYKRNIPGRIIGVTRDRFGNRALRMALQTREQHIKRERATSNICTAQALLANMAGFYAVYHGREGIERIAKRIHSIASFLSEEVEKLGYKQLNDNYFDTLKIRIPSQVRLSDIIRYSTELEMNFRYFTSGEVGISIDETTNIDDVNWILEVFAKANNKAVPSVDDVPENITLGKKFLRTGAYLSQDVFMKYRSETEMVRYIKMLEHKDISLTHSMISLGSCTMKLNAATEMLPLSWIEFNGIHPFVPVDQAAGYHEMFKELRHDLAVITGFADVSLQPNSGAAGELAGLMVIREYHLSRGDDQRDVVLIPSSAHGTNPASAVAAGMQVVVVKCDDKGNISLEDLKQKVAETGEKLAAFMITYPSTHGVYEANVRQMCRIIHDAGGQVYMDGANMNAQVGLTNPAIIGADVCHLNLHKTFAIPHGGGGPGVGPIAVAEHLVDFLPGHNVLNNDRKGKPVAAAPYGSASILPITYGYIKMLGADGLKQASEIAILNANYIAHKLKDTFGVLYVGEKGRVAHEMILECRHFKASGINEVDIAKRLMDYGFHAPTLSFPVHGTLMAEPTESESLEELDRFVDALKSIYNEIQSVEKGDTDKADNVLKNAPHTAQEVVSDNWDHKYNREKAAYPVEWLRMNKYWPPVARVDDAYGDRNLFCTCGEV